MAFPLRVRARGRDLEAESVTFLGQVGMPGERVEVRCRAFYQEVHVVNLIYRSTGGRYLGEETGFPQPDITRVLVMAELSEAHCAHTPGVKSG